MSRTATKFHVTGLGRQKIARVVQRAGQLGMTPEQYLKHLVDEDLAIAHEAQSSTIDQIMAPVRREFRKSGMSEEELGELVVRARPRRLNRNKR